MQQVVVEVFPEGNPEGNQVPLAGIPLGSLVHNPLDSPAAQAGNLGDTLVDMPEVASWVVVASVAEAAPQEVVVASLQGVAEGTASGERSGVLKLEGRVAVLRVDNLVGSQAGPPGNPVDNLVCMLVEALAVVMAVEEEVGVGMVSVLAEVALKSGVVEVGV